MPDAERPAPPSARADYPPGFHAVLAPTDPRALAVVCRQCGRLEFWSREEVADHGFCRHNPPGVVCAICGQPLIDPFGAEPGGDGQPDATTQAEAEERPETAPD